MKSRGFTKKITERSSFFGLCLCHRKMSVLQSFTSISHHHCIPNCWQTSLKFSFEVVPFVVSFKQNKTLSTTDISPITLTIQSPSRFAIFLGYIAKNKPWTSPNFSPEIQKAITEVNGIPTCLDPLMKAARTAWNFTGYVTSDSDAVSDAWRRHRYVQTPAPRAGRAGRGSVGICDVFWVMNDSQ